MLFRSDKEISGGTRNEVEAPIGTSETPIGTSETPITAGSSSSFPTAEDKAPKSPLPTKRRGRPTSKVWDHFEKKNFNGELRSVCIYCDKDYAYHSKKNGTSTLWNHLKEQCKKYPYKEEDSKQKILCFQKKSDGEGGDSNLVSVGFSQAACRTALAKMVVIDELPFFFVEQEGFRIFCSIACPKFDIPSRITVARDVMNLYKGEKEKLKSFFKKNSQRVSLTTDC